PALPYSIFDPDDPQLEFVKSLNNSGYFSSSQSVAAAEELYEDKSISELNVLSEDETSSKRNEGSKNGSLNSQLLSNGGFGEEVDFPYRLPNLLESHLRREASLQYERANSNAAHTRIVISNFVDGSRASCRTALSNAKPIPEPLTEAVKVKTPGAKVEEDSRRRRKFHTLHLGPMRFTSGDNASRESAGSYRRHCLRVQVVESNGAANIKAKTSVVAIFSSKSPAATLCEGGLLLSNSREVTPNAPSKNLLPPIPTTPRPSKKDQLVIATENPNNTRRSASINGGRGATPGVHSPNEAVKRKFRMRRQQNSLNNGMTASRRQQLEELNKLMSELSSRGVLIDRDVLERAILNPEDIPRGVNSKLHRIPMGWGLLAITLHATYASVREESEDIDDLDPAGKGLIPMHKLAVDSDTHLASLSARTNSWWTKDEFINLKRSWEERKSFKKADIWTPPKVHFNSYIQRDGHDSEQICGRLRQHSALFSEGFFPPPVSKK
ncbi:hypothetical protein BC829DRAFT_378239, partial [Chytridium lagenaria]